MLAGPGKRLFIVGLIAWGGSVVAAIPLSAIYPDNPFQPFGVLFLGPLVLIFLVPNVVLMMIFYGSVLGTPNMLVGYWLSAMKRNWRGFAGAGLIACAILAAANFAINL